MKSMSYKVLRHLILNPGVDFTYRKLVSATFGSKFEGINQGSLRASVYDILSYLEKEGLVKAGTVIGPGPFGRKTELKTFSFQPVVKKERVEEETDLLYLRYRKQLTKARRERKAVRQPVQQQSLDPVFEERAGGQPELVKAVEGLTSALNNFTHVLAALPWFMESKERHERKKEGGRAQE